MKYRIRKILSVLMILCLAVVSVPQMAMRAYADSSGKLKVVIAGGTKTIKYDAEKHEMPFKITYYIDKGNPGPPDAYEGAVDSHVNLKDQNVEYGKPLWPIDAGYYTTKLKDIYFDAYIATSSEYTFDDDNLIEINDSLDTANLTIERAPLTITATDQKLVYTGLTQGLGDTAYNDRAKIAGLINAEGLQGNDFVSSIVIDGQGTDVGEYVLEPCSAVINDNPNIKNYDILYVKGKLTIGYKVTVTPGSHMTEIKGSGELEQIVAKSITPISFTADDGYYFPEDYSVDTKDGIKVVRVSDSEIEVSGTPTENVDLTLPDAEPKEEPPVPHVHSLTLKEAKEATCTEAGNIEYYICDICGKWFEDKTAVAEITDKSKVVIPALGHKWDKGVVTKEATYSEEGVRTYTCLNDSSHTKTEAIPKKQRGSSGGSEHTTVSGVWFRDDTGWHYRENGELLKNAWRFLSYNGANYWYYFDEAGTMKTGWLEQGSNWYYLWPVSDGTMGRMVTGWQQIEGKWYYFGTTAGDGQGRMYSSGQTPDGYYVGDDGAWDGRPAGAAAISGR